MTVVATTQTPSETATRSVSDAPRWQTVLAIAGQLLLVLLVVHEFQLETATFFRVMLLASIGFVFHAMLPLKHRLSFFLLLSLLGVGAALGIRDGLWLIAAGVSLIAVCHLPIRFWLRVGLVLALAAAHAAARVGVVTVPWSSAVWPILGSMFMFRLALYLYAVRHESTSPDWRRSLAYFFMLPNVAYPLFPVVDYTTFGRTHYEGDTAEIYQRGMQWIARGLLHLLLYRFVYLHLTIPTSEVRDLAGLARSMLSMFLLYLRVSGQFHLAIGVLHLFGFRLPETHRLYYLASSFTDFWRRINIYWKDFMMKLVYYPSFFSLRRFGDRVALIGAIAIVFASTWLLHSYQWFWLQGTFPLTLPDMMFWAILGFLVMVATLREQRRGRKRILAKPRLFDVRRATRVTLMFCLMTILWSLWSTESVVEWLWLWSAALQADARDVALIAGVLGCFFVFAGHVWDQPVTRQPGPHPFYRQPALQTAALLGALLLLGQPAVYEMGGLRFADLVGSLKTNRLNAQDETRRFLGYYERLDAQGTLANATRNPPPQPKENWGAFATTAVSRPRSDFLVYDMVPNYQGVIWGARLTTNRWGMRDKDYALEKPVGVKRIALLGPSITMGSGVADADVFEAVLERELNDGQQAGRYTYEVLNFGVGGYSILQQMARLEESVFQFDPDVVIITMPAPEHIRMATFKHLVGQLFARGIQIPYPELRNILAKQGISEPQHAGIPLPYAPLRALAERFDIQVAMPAVESRARVAPAVREIVRWSLLRMGATIQAHGAVPVLLGMDDVDAPPLRKIPHEEPAQAAGFVTINLFDVYRGHSPDTLKITSWDSHPNAAANRLIAEQLMRELQKHDAILKLGLAK